MNEVTTTMNPELTSRLIEQGWNPSRIRNWGRRVSGDMNGVVLERNGKHFCIPGPFFCIHGGDQIAIVKFG